MTKQLESDVKELKELIVNMKKNESSESTVKKSNNYLRLVYAVIGIVVIVISAGITWGMTRSDVIVLKNDVETVKVEQKEQQQQIFEVKVDQAATGQTIKDIGEDISEIKQDIKKLANGE